MARRDGAVMLTRPIAGGRDVVLADFEAQLRGLGTVVREHRFAPPRQWRFDFCVPEARLAVEVQGIGKTQCRRCGALVITGGHGSVGHMESDNEKLAHALILGWRVLLVSYKQIRSGEAVRWARAIVGGSR